MPHWIAFFNSHPGYCYCLSLLSPCAVLPMNLRPELMKFFKHDPLAAARSSPGKYFGSLIVVLIALLPTIIYIFSVQKLSSNEGIDAGATIGSYIGLVFLASVFTAVGICSSSFTNNSVVAFIVSLIGCALLYYGFSAISHLPGLSGGADYYVEMAGIDFHYRSISRGVIDTRDVIYFATVIILFLSITNRNLLKR